MLLFVMSTSTSATAAALVVLGWGAFAGVASADPPAPSPAPAPPNGNAPAAGPKTTMDHDGVFNVGSDIVPGTYTSAGPVGTGVCYWKRLGDDAKQPLDNAMSKKPQIVRIEPTDKTFKTDGCQAWQKNDAAVPDPGKSPEQAGIGLGILNSLIGGGGGGTPPPASAPPPGAAPPAPAPAPPKS
ncbi:MAG: hypothetical protein WB777_00065 [Mycobacterium sp.]|jgi:hypothetical protein